MNGSSLPQRLESFGCAGTGTEPAVQPAATIPHDRAASIWDPCRATAAWTSATSWPRRAAASRSSHCLSTRQTQSRRTSLGPSQAAQNPEPGSARPLWELHSESGMSYFSLIARDAGPSETTMNSRTSPLGDRTNVNSSVPLPTKVVSVSGVSGSFGDGPDVSNGLLN